MKKIFVVAMVLLAASLSAQTIQENPMSGYIMFSGWSGDKFASANGGVKIGTQISIDRDRKLFLRTEFSSLTFKSDPIQSINVMPTMTWFVGKKWSLYACGGITGYVDGDNSGLDAMGGFGLSRRMWTDKNGGLPVPASIDLFGELLLTQSRDQASGGMAQLNVGIKFGRAE